jgi:hypothetical protein
VVCGHWSNEIVLFFFLRIRNIFYCSLIKWNSRVQSIVLYSTVFLRTVCTLLFVFSVENIFVPRAKNIFVVFFEVGVPLF